MSLESSAGRRPAKVCHIAATTEGAAWVFEQLRDLRDRHGYEVAAILNGDKGALVDKFQAAGIPIYSTDFDFTSNADLMSLPRKVLSLARLLRRERFDIIQTHLFHSMVIGRISAWFADVPVRFSMIAGPFHLEAYTPKWIDRCTCWLDTTIIASCEFTRSLYRKMGVADKRITVIYYGPDETKFDPSTTIPSELRVEFGWSRDVPLIGMVAYFYAELPRSRWIPPRRPRALGQGSGEPGSGRCNCLARLSARKNLVGRLRLGRWRPFLSTAHEGTRTGIRPGTECYLYRISDRHCRSLLHALDIAVQPSLSENLGGTIELLLMECPTIATRVGGLTDSVVDGKTGILVNPSDPESLADGILQMLALPPSPGNMASQEDNECSSGLPCAGQCDDLAALYEHELESHPAGYRPWVIRIRFAIGSLLCFAIAARYVLFEATILPFWDEGLRCCRSVCRDAVLLHAGDWTPQLGFEHVL